MGAGLHLGRARVRRAAARRVDRDADRAADPVRGRAFAVGARLRPARRAASSAARSPGCSRRSARRSAAGCARSRASAPPTACLGAVLIAAVGLGVVWILGALAVQSGSYRIRMEVQRSAILQRLNTVLPPSGPLLNSLRRLDPFPRIDGPEARRRRAAPGIARDPEVQEAAASVVKVLGTACGLGVSGSGWVAERRRSWSRTRTWWPGEDDTHVLLGGREPSLAGAAGPLRPAQRRRDPARRRARRRAAGRSRGDPRVGHVRGDPRLPAQRAVRRARGPAGGDASRVVVRRVRPRARSSAR